MADVAARYAKREWEFNVWHFHDPDSRAPRRPRTRAVQLDHAMPVYA
jgi:hypothetical protein